MSFGHNGLANRFSITYTVYRSGRSADAGASLTITTHTQQRFRSWRSRNLGSWTGIRAIIVLGPSTSTLLRFTLTFAYELPLQILGSAMVSEFHDSGNQTSESSIRLPPGNMMIGKLIVRVYRAEGLAAADINGKSDPFIKMNLVNQYHRTSTKYKTLNPEWNEMFHFDIYDINNYLDFLVYDEDRHGEDFLGRIIIPLLSIRNKQMVWYQLKNKKLQQSAKGRLLLRMDLKWSVVRACIRTFNPLEELKDPPPPQLRKSLMVSNFMRAKTQIMMIVDLLRYIKSCFQWENKFRSLNAFIVFLVTTYYFELWMVPFALLGVFCFNLTLIQIPIARELFGFDEAKFSSSTDIRYIMASDESIEDSQQLTSCKSMSSRELNNNSQDQEDDRTLVERLQAGKDVVVLVQDITGNIASYLERVTNTFTFRVPFLSYTMMFCLSVATVLLYLVPLRYVIMAWGINKFTKKLRNPTAIDNNELVDFLSRVPDNVQCIKAQNIVSY